MLLVYRSFLSSISYPKLLNQILFIRLFVFKIHNKWPDTIYNIQQT